MATCLATALLLSICTLGFCCHSGWFSYRGSCYSVISFGWHQEMAENYCHSVHGHLALANGSDYMEFFNSLPNFDEEKEYWIQHRSWTSDPYMDHTLRRDKTCYYVKSLYIRLDSCDAIKHFICEMKPSDVSCPTGFDNFRIFCLKAIYEKSNFEDASKECQAMDGELAVLDTKLKEYDAESAVTGKNQSFLIGVRRSGDVYKWINGVNFRGESFFHTNDRWNRDKYNAPSITEKLDCVVIFSRSDWPTVYKFEHVDCDQKYSFLCQADPLNGPLRYRTQTARRTTLFTASTTTMSSTEPTSTRTTSVQLQGFYCHSGWYSFRGTCYMASTFPWGQQMAENYCLSTNGNLALANGSDYVEFFNTLPNFDRAKEYWVHPESSWTSDPYMDHTQRIRHRTCYYAKSLYIRLDPCNAKKHFICEMKKSDVSCPTGFDNFRRFCLKAITDKANFEEASQKCQAVHGELAVLDSEVKEYDAEAAVTGKNQSFLIGVRRSGNVYKWINGVNFRPESFFHTNDPEIWDRPKYNAPNITDKLDCVVIFSESDWPTIYTFEHVDCDKKYSFLCQADPLNGPYRTQTPRRTTLTTPSTTSISSTAPTSTGTTSKQFQITDQKLPVGAIVGVVISLLVIMAIAGLVVYYYLNFLKKKQLKVTEAELL